MSEDMIDKDNIDKDDVDKDNKDDIEKDDIDKDDPWHADGRVVLCGANAYDRKYYFNPEFNAVPESIKRELNIISVLFTQEAGGIFTIVFESDGSISFVTDAEEYDITYDEVSAGLLVGEIKRKRMDILESLELFYRVMFLHEDAATLLGEDNGESDEADESDDGESDDTDV